MHFIDKIKKVIDLNKKNAIFFDMDGVMVEYNFDDDEALKNNVPGIYLNKEPIKYVIDIINELLKIDNLDIYILSACNFVSQANEKNSWLDKYLPGILLENRIFNIKEQNLIPKENKKISKGIIMEKYIKNYDKVILVDDTHDLLYGAKEYLKDKVIVFHVSSIL